MNDFSNHIIKSRFQALDDLLERCTFSPETESVPLDQACGRVLAEDLVSRNTLPNTLTATLDSIAVRFDDFAEGIPDTSSWTCGQQYCFANTGIGILGDFDTCIAIEDVEVAEDGSITVLTAPDKRGDKTVAAGSSMREGEVLVERGRTISPALVGLAAQAGHVELTVVRKPRVGFIPSGNELVPAGTPLPPGKSVDSNSVMIAAKLRQWGAEPVMNDICPDDWDTIKTAITTRLADCDILVVNAGSSKGTDDLTIEIIEEMGEVLNHEFSHGPGRHSSMALVAGKPVIGISGPPAGAEFCADWYVKPVIDAYYGRAPESPRTLWAILTEDLPARPRPITMVRRVSLHRADDGYLYATPLPGDLKPVLKMCDLADGFLSVPPDSHGFHSGEQVAVELRYPYALPV